MKRRSVWVVEGRIREKWFRAHLHFDRCYAVESCRDLNKRAKQNKFKSRYRVVRYDASK
jgi:hypothetical protein